MKNKLIVFLILLAGFLAVIGIRFFILDSQADIGKLKIVSTPSAGVFIDSAALGKTPDERDYKAGEYILKLIPEGTATQTASWQGKIKIYKNALTYVNRELGTSDVTSAGEIFTVSKMEKKPDNPNTGEIYVETEPNGSLVYLDNDEKGVAPLILSDVPRGDHELSISMPGFVRRTEKVNIEGGYRVNAQFKLALDPSQVPTPTPASAPAESETKPTSAIQKNVTIVIKDTPTGFLRVREEPTVNASESARVNPGDKFPLVDEQEGWYKIKYQPNKEGWISSQYSEKQQ